MIYTKFLNAEKEMVKALSATLVKMGAGDLRVATQKLDGQQSIGSTEVILRCNGRLSFDKIFSEDDFTIYIYTAGASKTAAVTAADDAAGLVAAALTVVKQASGSIKYCQEINSSVEEDAGVLQIRSIIFTAVSCGEQISI